MKSQESYIYLIGLHLAIGVVVYLNEPVAKLYFFLAFAYFVYRITVAANHLKTFEVLKACAYFVGAEVLFRTTRGAISYEAGKYLVIVFVLIGMLYKGLSGKGYPYFIYLMFLVPSIFVASTTLSFDANFRTNIAFVLSGPVCLGAAALFCYDKQVTFKQLSQLLLYMGLPILAHTAYVYLYAPDLREIITNTASNRAAAGGFGANQVATALGLGMFVFGVRIFTSSPTFAMKLLNAVLLVFISFRAIATFSRGGVVTAILCVAIFLVMYYLQAKYRVKNQILGTLILFIASLVMSWTISSAQTGGMVDKRYANENARGVEKEDITTGRKELFLEELEGFVHSPFLGIGSSRAKDQRIEEEGQGVTSHNELSRTLAEHGILGVIMLVILIFKPLAIRSRNRQNYYFYALLAFWFGTINHSSMRIAAPAFIYALALLNVTYETPSVHRKPLKERAV